MYFWGIVFFVTTTLVMLFKRETINMAEDEPEEGIVAAYKTLWRVIRLPSVLSLMGILLTVKVGLLVFTNVILCFFYRNISFLTRYPSVS